MYQLEVRFEPNNNVLDKCDGNVKQTHRWLMSLAVRQMDNTLEKIRFRSAKTPPSNETVLGEVSSKSLRFLLVDIQMNTELDLVTHFGR